MISFAMAALTSNKILKKDDKLDLRLNSLSARSDQGDLKYGPPIKKELISKE